MKRTVRIEPDTHGCERVVDVATGRPLMCGLYPGQGRHWAETHGHTIKEPE